MADRTYERGGIGRVSGIGLTRGRLIVATRGPIKRVIIVEVGINEFERGTRPIMRG